MSDDLDPLEQHLVHALRLSRAPRRRPSLPAEASAAWRAQIESRAIDHAARWLQSRQHGFYTIGSAGHESNALVALALRPSDPALLHYRSGGFYLARAGQAGHDGSWDVLLGMARGHGRADRRRAAQGVRSPRPRGHPPDLDDRVAPSARGRDRVRDRAGEGARHPLQLASRRGRRLHVRRRLAESRNRTVCPQRRGAFRLPRAAPAAPLRLRGQRARDQRADARGLGRAVAPRSARAGRRARRRRRPGRRPGDRAGARRRGSASIGTPPSSTSEPSAT